MKNALIILFSLAVALVAATETKAQIVDLKSEFGFNVDTVTNTGEVFLVTASPAKGKDPVTVVATVTKASGTVAGTLSLYGSLDGTNWAPIVHTGHTADSLGIITPANASGVYIWKLPDNPFVHYRVGYAGSGTMVAYISAKLKH